MSEPILELRDLRVSIASEPHLQIVKGVDLIVGAGEVHALMGPNGSGKSTLANAIAGSPAYVIDSGEVRYRGEDVTRLTPDARARLGMFLSFQYPTPIPGVTMVNMLRMAIKARRGEEPSAREFLAELRETLQTLRMDEEFARRYVNDGFSGGEKKRAEILQLGMLKPELAILDETDSGLDVDALRTVAEGVNTLHHPGMGHPADHALPADPQLHHAGPRARAARRAHRAFGWSGTVAPDRGRRLRSNPAGGRARRDRGGPGRLLRTERETGAHGGTSP